MAKMKKIKVRVRVDDNGKVDVTWRGGSKGDQNTVTFTSNRRDTAIKFKTSPVAEFRSKQVMKLNRAQGPFLVTREGIHHIDCGHLVGGIFKQWAETGEDIPIPC